MSIDHQRHPDWNWPAHLHENLHFETNPTTGELEEVWPCRCGNTHRGEYAVYDYGHHNCPHRAALQRIHDDIPDLVMCPLCGRTWQVETAEVEP